MKLDFTAITQSSLILSILHDILGVSTLALSALYYE